jgi:alkylation response protein AidB-like acyl-CoA dehydrogenase
MSITDHSATPGTPHYSRRPVPSTAHGWVDRAREVAAVVRADSARRESPGATPYAEVAMLKSAGLVTLLGPSDHGGGGQPWSTAYQVVREVAAADGVVGRLLGYHYLLSAAIGLVGPPGQVERLVVEGVRRRWFLGGAINPRAGETTVRSEGEQVVFNGRASLPSGSRVSDMTVLEGLLDGGGRHVLALVATEHSGLGHRGRRPPAGERVTGRDGVPIDVRVDQADTRSYRETRFEPLVRAMLTAQAVELMFVNLYLGITRGALAEALEVRGTRSPWSPGPRDGVGDPPVVDLYGDLAAELWAVEALADQVADEVTPAGRDRATIIAHAHGGRRARVAELRTRAVSVALEITNRIFAASARAS